ncbi:hypothetical protein J3F83DRAFT_485845 [Trichoderma novae-zelandiae]
MALHSCMLVALRCDHLTLWNHPPCIERIRPQGDRKQIRAKGPIAVASARARPRGGRRESIPWPASPGRVDRVQYGRLGAFVGGCEPRAQVRDGAYYPRDCPAPSCHCPSLLSRSHGRANIHSFGQGRLGCGRATTNGTQRNWSRLPAANRTAIPRTAKGTSRSQRPWRPAHCDAATKLETRGRRHVVPRGARRCRGEHGARGTTLYYFVGTSIHRCAFARSAVESLFLSVCPSGRTPRSRGWGLEGFLVSWVDLNSCRWLPVSVHLRRPLACA